MKENSIEEDIKNIEEIIELSKEEIDAKDENITAILDLKDLLSLRNLIKEYKKLEEENIQLEACKDEVIRRYNFESIPVSLVKEKIEEVNKEDENLMYKNNIIQVLQELLEKRK